MDGFFLTRLCLQKGLAFLYLIAFAIALFQSRALIGSSGILPLKQFIEKASFWRAPSLFFCCSSDKALQISSWVGLLLSLAALCGFSEQYGLVVSMSVWFCLWALYQSFVNVGQIFYGYGWEMLLLEAGFLAIFLGASDTETPTVLIWLYRWVLFRVMFGAGMIKMRCDPCWKTLTCLLYHYETQPIPGPLSRFFHRLSPIVHKLSVLGNHCIELIVPFFFFGPSAGSVIAGLLTIGFQSLLIISGNFSWLNYIAVVLCFSTFPDSFLRHILPTPASTSVAPMGEVYTIVVWGVACLIGYLSIKPIRNLFSSSQSMNRSYDCLHIVGTYGAFGSVTKVRKEIIIEGTREEVLTEMTCWIPYEFKAKPGDVKRRPVQVAPYNYKIDWQMWFAAMSPRQYHYWFLPFIQRLLEGNKEVLSLLKKNPFPDGPPKHIRAEWYEYHFAPPHNKEGVFWVRKKIGEYLPPVFLKEHL